MVGKDNPNLSIGKQCSLLSISRSSFCYQPRGETALNLALMRQIDEQFLETPFFVVRLDRSLAPLRRAHLHGWQGALLGQHLRGTALAVAEIRVRLSARLGNWIRSPGRDRKVGRVLQSQTPSQCPWSHGGKPPAVVFWLEKEDVQPGQQEQKVA